MRPKSMNNKKINTPVLLTMPLNKYEMVYFHIPMIIEEPKLHQLRIATNRFKTTFHYNRIMILLFDCKLNNHSSSLHSLHAVNLFS